MPQLDIITKHFASFARLMWLIIQPEAMGPDLGEAVEMKYTNPFANGFKSKQVHS